MAVAVAACGTFSGDGDHNSNGDGGASSDASLADGNLVTPIDGPIASNDAPASDAGLGCAWNAPFTSARLVDGVNTDAGESTARLTPDELTIYFSRSTTGSHSNILAASRSTLDASFGSPTLEVATPSSNLDPFITADGLSLYFDSDLDRNGSTILQLYLATRTSPLTTFTAGSLLSVNASGAAYTTGPYLSPIRGDLWFARELDGQSYDIYLATKNVGAFGAPAIVTSISTAANDELAPVLSSDELTIYYASSQDAGGGTFIWAAHRASISDDFGAPAHVHDLDVLFDGGIGDVRPSWLSPDNCRLYTYSFDATSAGTHVYVAERSPS